MANNTLAENLLRLQSATEDIADAIVEMGGTASSTDGLEDMPDAIRTIQANPTLITKSITANGTYDASDDSADGYSEVTVAVPNTYKTGTITYTSNSYFEISASSTAYLPSLQARGCGGLFSVIGGIKATTYQYGKPSGGSQYGYYLDIPAGTTLLEISGLDIPSGKTLNVVGSMYSTGGNHYIEGEDSVSVSSGSILVKTPERLYDWFGNTTAEKAAGYNLYITGYFT